MAPKSAKSLKDSNGEAAVLVVPSYLYLGPRSSSSSSFLIAHGITHVLSIGASPLSPLSNITYHGLSLSDDPTSPIDQVVADASAIIAAVAATPSGRIFVHCSAAVSRSPAIVAGYLVTKCGMSLRDALDILVRARPAICPNPGFVAQLKDLESDAFSVNGILGYTRSHRLFAIPP